jgi:hypothetical protein
MTLRRWISGVLAVASTVLLVLTLFRPQWIEGIFGVEPDSGDGSAETLLAVGLAVVAVMSSVDAAKLWWRLRQADPNRFVKGRPGHGQ